MLRICKLANVNWRGVIEEAKCIACVRTVDELKAPAEPSLIRSVKLCEFFGKLLPSFLSLAGLAEEPMSTSTEGYAVLKPAFLLSREEIKEIEAANCGADLAADTSSSDSDKQGHKRKRGMNQARSREELGLLTAASTDNLCRDFCSFGNCAYGDKCQYDHDILKYKELKPKDLADTCYMYETYGQCPEGFNCRFGESHSNWEKCEQLKRSEADGGVLELPKVLNSCSPELRAALRGHKYPFDKPYVVKGMNINPNNRKQKRRALEKDKTCFAWRKGECSRGDHCRFAHVEITDEELAKRKAAFEKAEAERLAAEKATAQKLAVEQEKAAAKSNAVGAGTIAKERKTIDFHRKVYVAPLTTVGNLPFRRIVKRFGADITCGEMALSLPLIKGQASEWALLKRHPSEDVFGCQVAGNKSDLMGRLAQVIEKEMNVDFVDLNLGCPIDVVCKRGIGAAMMQKPNQLRHVLEEMAPRLSCPITVKMRAGWKPEENLAHKLIHKVQLWNSELQKKLNTSNPVCAAIAIHSRSRQQRYTKQADWNYIRQCGMVQNNELPKLQLIGNGDVYSYVDWEKRITESGAATCLLARGPLVKPWLCTEIKEKRYWDISATERFDMYKDFVHFGLEHWGSDQQGVNHVRRFLLEWLSFTYRYIPVGLLERIPVQLNDRAPAYRGRNELETLLASPKSSDWVKISEMLLGKVPEGFKFVPKHKANAYDTNAKRA